MTTFELIVIALIIVLLTAFIRFLFHWRKRSLQYSLLPGPNQNSFIFGELAVVLGKCKNEGIDFHVGLLQTLLEFAEAYRKEGLCRIWFSYDPYILLYSAETLEPIFTSQNVITKSSAYNLLHCWLGTGLLTSTGNKWRYRRKVLTPTFHYSILDSFVPVFDHHSRAFVEKLHSLAEEEWVDIFPLVPLFTLDIICETAMGIKMECEKEESHEYAEAVAQFSEILMMRVAKPWLQNDFLFSATSSGQKHKRILHTLHSFSSKVVKRKKAELQHAIKQKDQKSENEDDALLGRKNRKAFLDLLLEMQLTGNSLSDEDICEEVDTFMFEGYDTVSAGTSWALFHLGHHPEIQERIYEEIQQVLGDDKDREITVKELRELKYLECVIKESQRISPSVPLISRLVPEDITISGYTIPRGATLSLMIYALHRDPKVFPDPEVFDPDRFLPENSAGRSPFAYVPFSAGPRNCIGQKFAMMELKTSLCNIIRNFTFKSLDQHDKIPKTALLVLRPKSELRLKFTRRE